MGEKYPILLSSIFGGGVIGIRIIFSQMVNQLVHYRIAQSSYNKFIFNFGATGLQQNLFTCEILFPVHF